MIVANLVEQRSWASNTGEAHRSCQFCATDAWKYRVHIAATMAGEKMEFALPQSVPRMCVNSELADSEDLYRTLQHEVDLGVQALKSGSPEMATSLFQSALHKVNLDHPFHAHLSYTLLLSYSLLIEQLLKGNDESTAHYFVHAALQLEIGSRHTHELAILKRFSAGFQSLGVMLLKHGLTEASLLCGRKAHSIFKDAGSYVTLKNSSSASSRERLRVQS